MSYVLYYATGSASMGVKVLLDEIGVSYKLLEATIDRTVPRSAEFLSLNPNGWVPVLTWGDQSIYECGAITIFLCDRHPEAQLSSAADSDSRGLFLQWLFYFSSSIQNAYQMTYYPDRFCDADTEFASVNQRSRSRLRELWQVVDDAIGNNQWVLGENFSAVDIYMFMLTTWLSKERGHLDIREMKNVTRICEKVMQRPATELTYEPYISSYKTE